VKVITEDPDAVEANQNWLRREPMEFIKPMAAHLPEDDQVMTDDRFVAEPKLDGCRLQLHVKGGKTVGCYSRTGRDISDDKGHEWLADVKWPLESGIFDCEVFSGDGTNTGGKTVKNSRSSAGAEKLVVVFDLLMEEGGNMRCHSWAVRRAALERIFAGLHFHPRVTLIPAWKDKQAMWDFWCEDKGGEGIMLKATDAPYTSTRSHDWLKVKVTMTVDVVVTGITDKPSYLTGNKEFKGCEAALTYGYYDPKKEKVKTVGQGVKWGNKVDLEQHVGKVAEVKCYGVMPGGALRHASFIQWRDDKLQTDCILEDQR